MCQRNCRINMTHPHASEHLAGIGKVLNALEIGLQIFRMLISFLIPYSILSYSLNEWHSAKNKQTSSPSHTLTLSHASTVAKKVFSYLQKQRDHNKFRRSVFLLLLLSVIFLSFLFVSLSLFHFVSRNLVEILAHYSYDKSGITCEMSALICNSAISVGVCFSFSLALAFPFRHYKLTVWCAKGAIIRI